MSNLNYREIVDASLRASNPFAKLVANRTCDQATYEDELMRILTEKEGDEYTGFQSLFVTVWGQHTPSMYIVPPSIDKGYVLFLSGKEVDGIVVPDYQWRAVKGQGIRAKSELSAVGIYIYTMMKYLGDNNEYPGFVNRDGQAITRGGKGQILIPDMSTFTAKKYKFPASTNVWFKDFLGQVCSLGGHYRYALNVPEAVVDNIKANLGKTGSQMRAFYNNNVLRRHKATFEEALHGLVTVEMAQVHPEGTYATTKNALTCWEGQDWFYIPANVVIADKNLFSVGDYKSFSDYDTEIEIGEDVHVNETVHYLEVLKAAIGMIPNDTYKINQNLIQFEKDEDGDTLVWLEDHGYKVTPDGGIKEIQRQREVNNMVVASQFAGKDKYEACEDDVRLLDSYGSFNFTLLNMLAGLEELKKEVQGSDYPINNWVKTYLEPMMAYDSLPETGYFYASGDQANYKKYVGIPYVFDNFFPFILDEDNRWVYGITQNTWNLCSSKTDDIAEEDPSDMMASYEEGGNEEEESSGNNWLAKYILKSRITKFGGVYKRANLTYAVANKYNLGQMPKSSVNFFNLQLANTRLAHIPKTAITSYVQSLVVALTGKAHTIDEAYLYLTTEVVPPGFIQKGASLLAIKGIVEELLCIRDSTKDTKGFKRVSHKIVDHPEHVQNPLFVGKQTDYKGYKFENIDISIYPVVPIDRPKALIRAGQKTGPSHVHLYNVAICVNGKYCPGVSLQLINILKPFLQSFNYKETILKPSAINWLLSEDKPEDLNVKNKEGHTHLFIDYTKYSNNVFYPKKNDKSDVETGDWNFESKGIFVKRGEVLISFTYGEGDHQTIKEVVAEEDCICKGIEIKTNTFNSYNLKIKTVTIKDEAKLRSYLKAMFTKAPAGVEVIYNRLNPGLLPNINLVLMDDTLKYKDMIEGLLPEIMQTHLANGREERIAKLNKLLGINESQHLHFAVELAGCGEYDKELAEFIEMYGRTLWLYHEDAVDGRTNDMRVLYTNKMIAGVDTWRQLSGKELEALLPYWHGMPTQSKGLYCLATNLKGDGSVCDKDEVLVWYKQGGKDIMWQRTWSYVGNKEHGHVVAPVQVELCSIDQSVTTAATLENVIHFINTGYGPMPANTQLAMNMLNDTASFVDKFAIAKACLNRRTFNGMAKTAEGVYAPKQLRLVKVFTKDNLLTPEFEEIAKGEKFETLRRAKANGELTFALMAHTLSDYIFDIGDEKAYIYLPVIANSDGGAKETQSLSGLVFDTFKGLMDGAKLVWSQLTARINGAFTNLAKSKGLMKKCFTGRPGVYAKTTGNFGVMLGDYVITKSYVFNSPYQVYLRRFAKLGIKNIDGQHIICTRTPLPFPAMLKIKVVENSTYVYKPEMDARANDPNAGDWDGDAFNGIPIHPEEVDNLKIFTKEDIFKIIELRTGKGALDVEQGAYAADHYNIKLHSLAWFERPTLVTKKNLVMWQHPDRLKMKPFSGVLRKTLLETSKAGVVTQTELVAMAHQIATKAEIFSGAIKTCKSLQAGLKDTVAKTLATEAEYKALKAKNELAPEKHAELMGGLGINSAVYASAFYDDILTQTGNEHWSTKEILLAIHEVYENPLGGLDWDAFTALCQLKVIMEGGSLTVNAGESIEAINDETGETTNLTKLFSDGGMNGVYTLDYIEIARMARLCNEIRSKSYDEAPAETYVGNSLLSLVLIATELTHKLRKGIFAPEVKTVKGKLSLNGYFALALNYLSFDPSLRAELATKSVIFKALERFFNTGFSAMLTEPMLEVMSNCGIEMPSGNFDTDSLIDCEDYKAPEVKEAGQEWEGN